MLSHFVNCTSFNLPFIPSLSDRHERSGRVCFSSPQLFIMAESYSTVCILPPDHSTSDRHDLVHEV